MAHPDKINPSVIQSRSRTAADPLDPDTREVSPGVDPPPRSPRDIRQFPPGLMPFLRRLLLFCSLTLLLFAALELSLRAMPNDYSLKNRWLDAHAESIEVLVLGSSHAYSGVDPQFLSGVSFNAANSSQSLNYDLKILKKYAAKFRQLKTVILPISSFTLFHNIEQGTENWRVRSYSLYYGVDVPRGITGLTEVIGSSGYTNYLKFKTLLSRGTLVNCDENGFLARSVTDTQDLPATAQRAAERHQAMPQSNFPLNQAYLNEIADLVESLDAQLILFTPPATRWYSDALEPVQTGEVMAEIGRLVESRESVSYVNFLTDPRFSPADFYDGDHLNTSGAKKLTLLLDEIIRMTPP